MKAATWYVVVTFPGDDERTTVKRCKSVRYQRAYREAQRFVYEHQLDGHFTVLSRPVGRDLTASPAVQVVE